MCIQWRSVQYRIFSHQLPSLLTNLENNRARVDDPASEMHWRTVELGVIGSTSIDEPLFERARALRYSIYPGRLLSPGSTGVYDAAFWQAQTDWLESQVALMEDDRRVMLDVEYHGPDPVTSSSSPARLTDLRRDMAPFLRVLARNGIVPLIHPVLPENAVFTEIADAVGGEICAQFEGTYSASALRNESTFGLDSVIQRDKPRWNDFMTRFSVEHIAPLRRRYPRARISHGYKDTILRKYWFHRLAELASVQDGHVFIDDEFDADAHLRGTQEWFDCRHPSYDMNEGVVEAYQLRGEARFYSRAHDLADGRVNPNPRQLTPCTSLRRDHDHAVVFDHSGLRYLIDRGTTDGLGHERVAYDPRLGRYSVSAFDRQRFTILLDFHHLEPSAVIETFGQPPVGNTPPRRSPLLSSWGAPGRRGFRLYWQHGIPLGSPAGTVAHGHYVFEVVAANGAPGSVQISVPDTAGEGGRRRVQIAHEPGRIRIWNGAGNQSEAVVGFTVQPQEPLYLNIERQAPEGSFYSSSGIAFEQLVIWDRVLDKIPTKNYPFMESQS